MAMQKVVWQVEPGAQGGSPGPQLSVTQTPLLHEVPGTAQPWGSQLGASSQKPPEQTAPAQQSWWLVHAALASQVLVVAEQ